MGILFGLASAVTTGFLAVFLKRLRGVNPNFLTFVRMASSATVLAVLVTLLSHWAIPPREYWLLIFFVIVPLEIALAFIGTLAFQRAPLSLVGPLGAFTSVFLIPMGYIVLGELPTLVGTAGIFLVVSGSFVLGWRRGEMRFAGGLGALLREPGSWFALSGAFLASLTTTFAKYVFAYAPPLLSAFYTTAAISAVLLPVAIAQSPAMLRMRWRDLVGAGLSSGSTNAFHYVGLAIVPVAYFISIKRLSTVVDVLLGRVFFREEHIRERLVGAAVMFAGVILIAIG